MPGHVHQEARKRAPSGQDAQNKSRFLTQKLRVRRVDGLVLLTGHDVGNGSHDAVLRLPKRQEDHGYRREHAPDDGDNRPEHKVPLAEHACRQRKKRPDYDQQQRQSGSIAGGEPEAKISCH